MYKELLKPSCVLGAICLIISLALAFTYELTLPQIEAAKKQSEENAKSLVLNKADSFVDLEIPQGNDNILQIFKANNNEGYVFITKTKGFGGNINVMVGIDKQGCVNGIQILEQKETPGLGTKITNEDYINKYLKKTHEDIEGVDTISGATVSSKALKLAIQNVYKAYEQIK